MEMKSSEPLERFAVDQEIDRVRPALARFAYEEDGVDLRNMKRMAAVLTLCAALTGCMSMFPVELGITEKQWLRTTLVADLAYMDGNVTAYKSNGSFYYFRDGKLVKVDQGFLPAQTIRLEVVQSGAEAAQK